MPYLEITKPVTIEAPLRAPTGAGGQNQFFRDWTLAGISAPSGYTVNDRIIVFPAATTDFTATANYINGETISLTTPANGTIIVTPAVAAGDVGYPPGTIVTFEWVANFGFTLFVTSWTGATATPENPNIATLTIGTTAGARAVSATTSSTKPAVFRNITLAGSGAAYVEVD